LNKKHNIGIDYGEVIELVRSAGIIPRLSFMVEPAEDRDVAIQAQVWPLRMVITARAGHTAMYIAVSIDPIPA